MAPRPDPELPAPEPHAVALARGAFNPVERGSHPGRAFVGRRTELARVLAAAAEAAQGHGRILVLAGAPGIGKTSAAEQAIARTGFPSERVLRSRCLEQPGAPAFLPWRRVLRALLAGGEELLEGTGAPRAVLADLLPELAEGRPAAPLAGGPGDPQERRFVLLDALAGVLLRAAAREPLVLLLDDLHWADPSSLEVLEVLAADLSRSHLLVLGTARDLPSRAGVSGVARLGRFAELIRLEGLGSQETAELVGHCAAAPVAPALAEAIHGLTGGNPFFVDETVRLLRTRGRLAEAEPSLELPESVREVVRGHLEPLPAEARALLALASVMGHEFDLAALRAAADLDAEAVLQRLGDAAASGFVESADGSPVRFRFVHALIPETLYAELTPLERARLHRRVGEALEALHGGAVEPPAAALAYHWFRAAPLGDAERAVVWTARAGQQAFAARAYQEAAGHLAQALDALALAGGDERRRLGLLLELGRGQTYAGLPAALETFESAVRVARALGDHAALAQAALQSDPHGVETLAPNRRFVAVLEDGVAALPEDDSPLRVALLARLASALYFAGDAERCHALADEAVERGRRLGAPVPLAVALLARQYVLWGPDGDPVERLALSEEALALLDAAGERRLAIACERWRIEALFELGALAEAEQASARLSERCSLWHLPLFRLHARHTEHAVGLLRGRYAAVAEALARDDAGPLARLQPLLAHSWEAPRLMARLEAGGLEKSEAPIRTILSEFPGSWLWRSTLALVVLELGRAGEARALIEPLAEQGIAAVPRDGFFLPTLAVVAEVAARLGARQCAEIVYHALLPLASRHVVFGVGANGFGCAERYLGMLALALGRPDDAAGHLERGRASNERAGLRPFAAWCGLELARALEARDRTGDRERAAALRAEARHTAAELGMGRLLARAGEAAPAALARVASPREEVAVLQREGELWRVAFAGRESRLRHAKGFTHLAELLLHPGREFHSLDLVAGPDDGAPGRSAPRAAGEAGLALEGEGDSGELIDARARAEYEARLVDLREDLAEAERFGDPERAGRAREELDALAGELARAVGLGGRLRRSGSAAERARLNVSRAIAATLRKIARDCPALGEHLSASVRTGSFCSYRPDPRLALRWEIRR